MYYVNILIFAFAPLFGKYLCIEYVLSMAHKVLAHIAPNHFFTN